ncbi:MAG: hypothetical protein FJ220_06145 [Kiritimatiellaceae bacterium]|nr:hypothetical protein [Kiritimatiellaceae bacterium]
MEIRTLTLNGKWGKVSLADGWIAALNDARLTVEKGGFLFKVAFDGDHLMLAVAPTLIGDTRSYHYDLHLEKEDAFTLIGDVNAQGVFTLLFKPDRMETVRQCAADYVERYRRFAAFLIDAGYSGQGRLSDVTQCVLMDIGLMPPPGCLNDLMR